MRNIQAKKLPSPLLLPILFFLVAIVFGAILLHSDICCPGGSISWIDALFTATSATCVTGLTVLDISIFSRQGQVVLLVLMQAGGLGIMTFTSLAFYLWRRRVSLTDRVAVGQSLLSDSRFHLGHFLVKLFMFTFLIEGVGAVLLYIFGPDFTVFTAVFHAVSAFCNAGFSLFPTSLISLSGNWPVMVTIMALIILGGLGFAVLVELQIRLQEGVKRTGKKKRLSWQTAIVLQTTFFLIVVGWLFIYLAEFSGANSELSGAAAVMASLFQSVTCRTAGFNSMDIAGMTNVSLLFMIILMFIGGGPGSCAGGIKVTTIRVLWAFVIGQIKGHKQVVVGDFAVDKESLNRAVTLLFFSLALVFISVLLLDFTEGGKVSHSLVRGQFLEILFEVVSAFGTAGLSVGLTAKLSAAGKIIIVILMFVGRLGPLMLLSALQSFQDRVLYLRPEENISIG